MKRHVQEPGIRKWSGTDLVELQSEPFKALDGFFGSFGPMILSGCEVKGNIIAPGLIILPGPDDEKTTNGKTQYRIATFAGISDAKFPVHLKVVRKELKREYVNASEKRIAYEYTAELDNDNLKIFTIEATGGKSFADALQDSEHLFVTDEEKTKWNSNKSGDRSPFAIFDGTATTSWIVRDKAPANQLGSIIYLYSHKTFVKRITPFPGRFGVTTYYTDWDGREEYTENYLPGLPGTTSPETLPYMNKLYMCDGIMYYWTGDSLEKVGGSDKENYSALINKPRINGVELKGDVSLQALGLTESTCPFAEILEDDVDIDERSFGSSNGDIVFVSSKNIFALRVKSSYLQVGPPVQLKYNNQVSTQDYQTGYVPTVKYYGDWMGAQDYVEFYTPPLGDGSAHPRPPLGRIYSIGQVRYYWDGTGLKVYGYSGGNGQTGMSPMVEFDGVIENADILMASVMGSGRVFFAKNSHYGSNTIGGDLNIFVLKSGDSYYNNWMGRESYSDDTLTPFSGKFYRCGGSLYLWNGTTLVDVASSTTLSMRFGTLLKQAHSTGALVESVIGLDFYALYRAVKNNASLLDTSVSVSEPAQVTARCITTNGKSQVTVYFPFEYYQAATLSTLTISDDFTAEARHFKMTATN